MRIKYTITTFTDENTVREHLYTNKTEIRVGRANNSDLKVQLPSIEEDHLRINLDEKVLFAKGKGCTLNGLSIHPMRITAFRFGDVIGIRKYNFVFGNSSSDDKIEDSKIIRPTSLGSISREKVGSKGEVGSIKDAIAIDENPIVKSVSKRLGTEWREASPKVGFDTTALPHNEGDLAFNSSMSSKVILTPGIEGSITEEMEESVAETVCRDVIEAQAVANTNLLNTTGEKYHSLNCYTSLAPNDKAMNNTEMASLGLSNGSTDKTLKPNDRMIADDVRSTTSTFKISDSTIELLNEAKKLELAEQKILDDSRALKEFIATKQEKINQDIQVSIEHPIIDTPVLPSIGKKNLKDLGEAVWEKEILQSAEKVLDVKIAIEHENIENALEELRQNVKDNIKEELKEDIKKSFIEDVKEEIREEVKEVMQEGIVRDAIIEEVMTEIKGTADAFETKEFEANGNNYSQACKDDISEIAKKNKPIGAEPKPKKKLKIPKKESKDKYEPEIGGSVMDKKEKKPKPRKKSTGAGKDGGLATDMTKDYVSTKEEGKKKETPKGQDKRVMTPKKEPKLKKSTGSKTDDVATENMPEIRVIHDPSEVYGAAPIEVSNEPMNLPFENKGPEEAKQKSNDKKKAKLKNDKKKDKKADTPTAKKEKGLDNDKEMPSAVKRTRRAAATGSSGMAETKKRGSTKKK